MDGPWHVDKAKSFLWRRDQMKVGKYEAAYLLEGWGLLPMAFSTWATPGPGTFGLLSRWMMMTDPQGSRIYVTPSRSPYCATWCGCCNRP